jgi:hypothetical protein
MPHDEYPVRVGSSSVRYFIICAAVIFVLVLALSFWERLFPFALVLFVVLVPVGCVASVLIHPSIFLRLLCLTILTLELLFAVITDRGVLPVVAARNAIEVGQKTGRASEDYQAGAAEAIRQVRACQHYNPVCVISFVAIIIIAFVPRRTTSRSTKAMHEAS